jgi:Flp pilus assembly protein CpaB
MHLITTASHVGLLTREAWLHSEYVGYAALKQRTARKIAIDDASARLKAGDAISRSRSALSDWPHDGDATPADDMQHDTADE